jgi:Cu(I)/Ag(I) efflux system periplasmic protein CusF
VNSRNIVLPIPSLKVKSMKLELKTLFVIAAASVPLSALAAAHAGAPMASPTTSVTAAAEMTEAEVRKVDKEGSKLTLKHGAIKNLDMPGMTMVFQVKDKAMLDKLQAGDKVKFKAVNDAGKFTVTEIQPVK